MLSFFLIRLTCLLLIAINFQLIQCELPVIQKFPTKLEAVAGQKLRLGCLLYSGSAPVDFLWFKDNQIIVSSSRYSIKSNDEHSVLFANQVQSNDAGTFKCLAKNNHGNDSSAVQVIVKGKFLVTIKFVFFRNKFNCLLFQFLN